MTKLLTIAALALTAPAFAQDALTSSALGQTLNGGFTCKVSITSALPQGVPNAFPGGLSFFSDGNALAQANGDGPAAIQHGSWFRTGDRTFRAAFAGFSQDDKLRYTGPFKVFYNFRLEPDLNALSGAYRVDFFDTNGNKTFSFSGKSACSRVQIENFEDMP